MPRRVFPIDLLSTLGALALLSACASGSSSSTTSSGGASSTGGTPEYVDAGTCLNNGCANDSDCCTGFACSFGSCCQLPSAHVQCLLDSDCCSLPGDAGSTIPYCNPNGQCAPAPNCAQINSPCTNEACCPQPNGDVFCNPVNGLCAYGQATTGSTGGSTTGGSTGTSGGFGSSSGTSSGAATSGSTGTGGSATSWVFSWSFGVNEPCEQAGVSWVEVQLTGISTTLFPCRDPSGNEGATTPAPALTQTDYTLVGYDESGGTQLAAATGTTPVALGPTPVPVDLSLGDGGGSNLDLTWTFGGQSCAQAGVTQVDVGLIDPNNPVLDVDESVSCSSSLSLKGYGRGQYPMTFSASGSDAGYQATASVSANGVSDSLVQVDLLPSSTAASGDVLVNFDFGGEGCVAAGLDSVGLQLSTIRGTALAPAVVLGCDAGASYLFSSVPAAATGFLWVEGISQGQVQQLSNPQVVVSPGGTATYSVVTQLGNWTRPDGAVPGHR